MANNKETDIKRPLDAEKLTEEQESKINGGAGSDFSEDPAIFNISYFNSPAINMPLLGR